MGAMQRALGTTAGKILGIAFSLAAVGMAVYVIMTFLNGDMPDTANYTTYICSETGKSFRHKNEMGETIPIASPFSGKNTAYPAEACYWNSDGTTKKEPTWVLLNDAIGKNEPTFCPDCGRLVVGHNPRPVVGAKPPPTKVEYASRNSRLASGTDRTANERSN